MKNASLNDNKILSEANRLISNGLRKAAIDLLLEHLETTPDSSIILSTLGRIYLLDHQPEKAVIFLKKSLSLIQKVNSNTNPRSSYQSEDFSENDMAYIDSQADILPEEKYELNADSIDSKADTKEQIFDLDSTLEVTQFSEKNRELRKKEVTRTLPHHDSQPPLSPQKGSPQKNHFSNKPISDSPSPLKASPYNDQTTAFDEPGTTPPSPDTPKKLLSANDENKSEYPKKREGEQINEDDNKFSLYHDNLHWDDVENPDLVDTRDLFTDDIEWEDFDDDLLDTSESSNYNSHVEEDSYELNWDDFEDLDEFDESANRESEQNIDDEQKINRMERARQVAVIVLAESGWDSKHLSLLQNIFFENGWSAARAAIQREIEKGVLPEELALARRIKNLWSNNEQYWITFQKIRSNQHTDQAAAAYRNMSWLEALRIIRSFPSLPEIEEIYTFIDETYDHWYNSNRLRRSFKAFYKYLRYRTGLMRGTLPGDCIFIFQEYNDTNVGVDSNSLLNFLSPVYQELEQLGVLPISWPKTPENKMIINKESQNL